jgi:hypothetical protein
VLGALIRLSPSGEPGTATSPVPGLKADAANFFISERAVEDVGR